MSIITAIENRLLRTPASGNYLRFIDGLRFLAIVPVILQHSNDRLFKYGNVQPLSELEDFFSFLISRGTIGVFLFFAISGFVLTLPYGQKVREIKYKEYLVKRLRRIEPPYLFWMSVFALILYLKSTYPQDQLFTHYLATITYTHQAFFQDYSWINPVAWSLEVEIQFYLLAPFLAKGYFAIHSIPKRRLLLGALVVGWILIQQVFGWNLLPWKPSLLGYFQHFLIGMLAADFYLHGLKTGISAWIWDLLAIPLGLVMAFTWTDDLGKTLLFNVSLLLLLIASWQGNIFKQFLSYTWVAIIGGMCYTTYLTHLPLLELMYSLIGDLGHSSGYFGQLSISLLIVLPLILLSSMIFYVLLEQPFMKPLNEFKINLGWKKVLTAVFSGKTHN